jgi:hypothetical protein
MSEHLTQDPGSGARVRADRRRDARRQRGGQQLMRRGTAIAAAEALGLVGGEAVAAVDEHVVAQRVAARAGAGGQLMPSPAPG